MSDDKHTDESRLDLSDDADFAYLVKRRTDLSEIEKAGRTAEKERKEIDEQIVQRLGNAKSATTSYGEVVTLQTIKRPEFLMKATVYTKVSVRHVKRKE